MTQPSMSLKYEPSSEPLRISVNQLGSVQLEAAYAAGCRDGIPDGNGIHGDGIPGMPAEMDSSQAGSLLSKLLAENRLNLLRNLLKTV